MPSDIKTPVEYFLNLRDAIFDMKKVVGKYPGDKGLAEILRQLELAEHWTRGGHPPTLDQKGQLHFGLLASKFLDDTDQELAQRIYDIASYITYW